MPRQKPVRIEAIIFDFGDVICFWDDRVIGADHAKSLGVPDDSIRELLFDYMRQGGEGKYHSFLDYFDRAKPETPVKRDHAHQAFNDREASAIIDTRMVELISRLKPHYKIGMLSNYTKGLEESLVDRFHIHHLFDAIVSSYTIKMRKPTIDAYIHVAKKLQIDPAQCLFVDDKERNTLAAAEAGMKTVLFTGFEDLVHHLKQEYTINVETAG